MMAREKPSASFCTVDDLTVVVAESGEKQGFLVLLEDTASADSLRIESQKSKGKCMRP